MDKLKEYVELIMNKFGDHKAIVIMGVIIIGLLLMASMVDASPNQNHTCQGGHNCNQGGEGNEQSQAQAQYQSTTNNTSVSNDVEVDTRSSSYSGANSNSGGNRLSANGGQSSSSSNSAGGSATAAGGNSIAFGGVSASHASGGEGGVANATSGDASANAMSGDASASSGGNNLVGANVNFERSAASAATVFAGHCQTGASAQAEVGGFSVINSDQFCDYIRLAAVMREAYEWEVRDCICVGVCTTRQATVEMECKATNKAEDFLDAYYSNLWHAQGLLEHSSGSATADRIAGQAIRPMAVLGMLMWLL